MLEAFKCRNGQNLRNNRVTQQKPDKNDHKNSGTQLLRTKALKQDSGVRNRGRVTVCSGRREVQFRRNIWKRFWAAHFGTDIHRHTQCICFSL